MEQTGIAVRSRPSGPPAAWVRGRGEGGIGRRSSPAAERVSDHLRRSTGGGSAERRAVSGLSLLASLATVASVPFAAPEARAAWRSLRWS